MNLYLNVSVGWIITESILSSSLRRLQAPTTLTNVAQNWAVITVVVVVDVTLTVE